ncbi:ARM repeat superfamily protein [Actinidia rufa]|uniref:RING-type E3 ubiquitin transferase n=1 Tax=Actinidia rufa TaxID=165716 RepID=A0A7J0EC60_9ERIC|nr:ARM repeat superfamily protein [Actinidia rufa]
MHAALPPLMVSSGFLPTGPLLESLTDISSEVISMDKFPFVQITNVSTMIRRIKLLSSLYEEIQEINSPLPPSSILSLTELRALDILPLSLLNLTADTKEQVELLHKQAKRVELYVDTREIQIREEFLQVMATNNEKNSMNKGFIDFRKLKEIFSSIGLRSSFDYDQEITKLGAEAEKQAGTGGLIVVSNINNLISLISLSKSMIFSEEETEKTHRDLRHRSALLGHQDHSSPSQSIFNVPDEFCCPISLDLMRDPVIVASGQTYDRNSIAQWINSGHHTCPKTGRRLIHKALIPNYALKSLIHQWCQENNIPVSEPASSPSSSSERGNSKRKSCEKAIDHISATEKVMDDVKMTAEFLVGKLATGSPNIQRQAAYELRLLAKTGMDNRRLIAEAGAIPFLVTLLSSPDPRIQENAVTGLLNLSIFKNNKILIMAAGAIDSIIDVLLSGKTTEARENAAAAIFSLSIIDDYKVMIGVCPRAIPALVKLLGEGSTAGKRDAATALFNLAVYNVNKASVVVAGAVPLLIDLLMDDKAGITDDALAVLALLLGCSEGVEEILTSRVLVPLLIDLLRFGSPKGKENSITLLLGLCKDGGEDVARRLLTNPRSIPSLQSLAAEGSLKAQRKAEALLRLLNRCCSQSRNPAE